MGRRAFGPKHTKGISFPQLGGKWYVFRGGRNRIGPYATLDEAQEAAAKHFDKKRKKSG